jgi:hypothetical protein
LGFTLLCEAYHLSGWQCPKKQRSLQATRPGDRDLNTVIFFKTYTAAKMSEVIDWDEAMQQCGDDEEFLRELLADLRSETDTQVQKIEETIRVSHSTFCFAKAVGSRRHRWWGSLWVGERNIVR